MLASGDVTVADLGEPTGREAGFPRPVVVITAQTVLNQGPSVVAVVPLTTTLRGFGSEVEIAPDDANGLDATSAAQCQHVRAVSTERLLEPRGNVGSATLAQIREVLADLIDL